jgi:hypothetical protein
MPKATSSAIDPVGITSTGARASSPSRMTDPLPNCRSIWTSAVSRAFSLSPLLTPLVLSLPAIWTPCRGEVTAPGRAASDASHVGGSVRVACMSGRL